MRRSLWLAAVAVAATTTLGAVAAARLPAGLDAAHHAYYDEQFDRSLALYERLAAAGDPVAAERAGFMRLVGEPLYGPRVQRDAERAHALLLQAARAGRPGAAFLIGMLERTE
ncbi:hypothetical protein [Pseudorhodoferax sp.]|uniref:hypothetical protein n=1 Tax=Pseudorhodoferax sp. TaxID=1993553 RepID=UPI0039E2D96F